MPGGAVPMIPTHKGSQNRQKTGLPPSAEVSRMEINH
jgi:hypothetical protein